MEERTVLYFDGIGARPAEVRVLFFNDQLHLYDQTGQQLLQEFSLAGMAHNEVGNTHYVYLQAKGLQYLQFTADHPLAFIIPEGIALANPHWGQKLMRQKLPVLVLLVVVLGIGAYCLVLNLVPFLGMRMIGVKQEIVMGNKIKQVLLQETNILGSGIDTAGTGKLQSFADRLNLSTDYPIQLTLVNSDIVNAYALPGGQIVVYRGILEKIKTPEGLAALLAHESSHVNERHSLRSLLRNAATGIIIAVIFNDATGVSGAIVSNANALNGLHYSRSLEEEADRKGMDLLVANNVNVTGMKELMEELKKEGDVPGNLSFLSSHPLTKERIKSAINYMNDHPQKKPVRNDLNEIFQSLKDSSYK
jgi:beta-barrel assembly-enhancing protease